jgi:hypothetical protein
VTFKLAAADCPGTTGLGAVSTETEKEPTLKGTFKLCTLEPDVPVTVSWKLPTRPVPSTATLGFAGKELTLAGDTLQLVVGKVQERLTLAENPSCELIRMGPAPVCPDFTTGNAVGSLSTKSALSWTFSVKDCVFDAGAPATVPAMLTV